MPQTCPFPDCSRGVPDGHECGDACQPDIGVHGDGQGRPMPRFGHRHTRQDWADAGRCPGPEHSASSRPDGAPVWCLGHKAAIGRALGSLPDMAALLPDEYVSRTANPDGERTGKVGKAADAPSPSVDVDTVDEIAQWLHEWTCIAIGHLRRHGPVIDTAAGLPHLDASITEGSRWLLDQWDVIAADRDFPIEFGCEALALAGRVGVRLRLDEPENELGVPCDYCGRTRLRQINGTDQVRCGYCGRSWGKDRYELLYLATRRALADGVLDTRARGMQRFARTPMPGESRIGDPDHIVTTAQAAALCRVEPATVRSWVFRGYLVPHGRRGRFRLGDVDVAERMVRERESYTPEQRILAAILSETP